MILDLSTYFSELIGLLRGFRLQTLTYSLLLTVSRNFTYTLLYIVFASPKYPRYCSAKEKGSHVERRQSIRILVHPETDLTHTVCGRKHSLPIFQLRHKFLQQCFLDLPNSWRLHSCPHCGLKSCKRCKRRGTSRLHSKLNYDM